MSKLAPLDQRLTTLNGSFSQADERYAKLGCVTNGRTRQISVHAPRTTLIDTDWDTIGDTEETPIESNPIPSTVRQVATPASPKTPASMARVGVAVAVPSRGRVAVAESLQQQDRTRNAPARLRFFLAGLGAGLVAGIGITVGLSMVINDAYRMHHDGSQGSAVLSERIALPQLPTSEHATNANRVPDQPPPTAPGMPASRPEATGTQASNGSERIDDSVQPSPSGRLDAPPGVTSAQPSASSSKQVRTAVPQLTRRVTRVRRPKPVANDNPY